MPLSDPRLHRAPRPFVIIPVFLSSSSPCHNYFYGFPQPVETAGCRLPTLFLVDLTAAIIVFFAFSRASATYESELVSKGYVNDIAAARWSLRLYPGSRECHSAELPIAPFEAESNVVGQLAKIAHPGKCVFRARAARKKLVVSWIIRAGAKVENIFVVFRSTESQFTPTATRADRLNGGERGSGGRSSDALYNASLERGEVAADKPLSTQDNSRLQRD